MRRYRRRSYHAALDGDAVVAHRDPAVLDKHIPRRVRIDPVVVGDPLVARRRDVDVADVDVIAAV